MVSDGVKVRRGVRPLAELGRGWHGKRAGGYPSSSKIIVFRIVLKKLYIYNYIYICYILRLL